jgi:hypothetical protein
VHSGRTCGWCCTTCLCCACKGCAHGQREGNKCSKDTAAHGQWLCSWWQRRVCTRSGKVLAANPLRSTPQRAHHRCAVKPHRTCGACKRTLAVVHNTHTLMRRFVCGRRPAHNAALQHEHASSLKFASAHAQVTTPCSTVTQTILHLQGEITHPTPVSITCSHCGQAVACCCWLPYDMLRHATAHLNVPHACEQHIEQQWQDEQHRLELVHAVCVLL